MFVSGKGQLCRRTVCPKPKLTDIMLLDYFLKAGVVELGELGQVMHIGDDITQILFQQLEIIL